MSPHGQGPQGITEHRPQGEIGRVELQFPSLDLREIEQVVDDGEQVVGRRLDRLQALPLVVVHRRIEDQFGHADDGVHGRADFMADVGQELILGAIGRFGRLSGLARLLLQPFAFGDILQDRDRVGRLARRIALEGNRYVDPDQGAILTDVPLLQRVAGQFAPHEREVLLEFRLQILGVGDVLEGPREQL